MRVVLAVDGSIAADRARDLVASLELPVDSEIRVVAALDEGPAVLGMDWPEDRPGTKYGPESPRQHLMTALETAKLALESAGHPKVDSVLLRGEPARAIIDEASAYEADLIVVGHRGRGAFTSALLGSTSTALVEHAPCPLLVVRQPTLRSVLLAEDGSKSSGEATEAVASWPIFDRLPITVVSVADVRIPIAMEVQPGIYEQVVESYIESADLARAQTRETAASAAERLTAAGRLATIDVREGSPATTIVEAAQAHGVDLIVMGTRGHTGLARIALGGTARSVMLHAPCSVLVVRGLRVEPALGKASTPLAASRP
jgi:nucleotide-binding universal stress UspA family protein